MGDGALVLDFVDMLAEEGEAACVRALHGAGGHTTGTIDIIVDVVTPLEALMCARTLFELGREVEATELVHEVLRHSMTPPLVPQGDQDPADEPQTLQN